MRPSIRISIFSVLIISLSFPAFSQSRVNVYTATPFQATWTDIATTADTFHYVNGDMSYGIVTLPFDFPYDDSVIKAGSKIYIGAAGVVSFLPVVTPTGPALGNPDYPGLLCIFSAALVAGKGNGTDSDYYELDGTAPNRIFTVEYHFAHMPHTGSGGGGGGTGGNSEMMQVKFYETSGNIEFIYQSHNSKFEADSSNLGAIGLNGFSTPTFVSNIYEASLTATPASDIRFTPGSSATSVKDSVFISKPIASGLCGTDTATITVMNQGTIAEIYSAIISGSNAADFSILASTSSPLVAPGGTATFKVIFVPTLTTAETATFTISGGSGGSVQLNATGAGASIAGNGTAQNTQVGKIDTFLITIHNTGSCDWTPGSPIVNAPFSYIGGGFISIAAEDSGVLVFAFAPTATGDFTSPITFPNATGRSIPAPRDTVSGTAVTASVVSVSELGGFSIGQNYPNPARNQTSIEITMAARQPAELALLDEKGSVVEILLNQTMDRGTFELSFDLSNLEPGVYYYRLKTGTATLIRSMVIER